jgi:hypothetical protein
VPNYYAKIKGSVKGPFSAKQLRDLANSGKLSPDSLIRLDGSDRWIAASKFNNLVFSQPASPLPSPTPSYSGNSQNLSKSNCTHCGVDLGIPKGLEGKRIRCKHCGKITMVVYQEPEFIATTLQDNGPAHVQSHSAPIVKESPIESKNSRRYQGSRMDHKHNYLTVLIPVLIFAGVLIATGITITFLGTSDPEQFNGVAKANRGDDGPVFKTTNTAIRGGGVVLPELKENRLENQTNKDQKLEKNPFDGIKNEKEPNSHPPNQLAEIVEKGKVKASSSAGEGYSFLDVRVEYSKSTSQNYPHIGRIIADYKSLKYGHTDRCIVYLKHDGKKWNFAKYGRGGLGNFLPPLTEDNVLLPSSIPAFNSPYGAHPKFAIWLP